MTINSLIEMPELKNGDRQSYDIELCSTKHNLIEYNGIPIESPFDIRIIIMGTKQKFYLIDTVTNCIVSILETDKYQIKNFKGLVQQEESIDTCNKYRKQGITTKFYKAILKNKLSILSDYKHYTGTKYLWLSLSKDKDISIHIIKNNHIIESNYDLKLDKLHVWQSNNLLLLAVHKSTKIYLENLIISS